MKYVLIAEDFLDFGKRNTVIELKANSLEDAKAEILKDFRWQIAYEGYLLVDKIELYEVSQIVDMKPLVQDKINSAKKKVEK